MSYLDIDNLSVTLPHGQGYRQVVKGVSLTLNKGEILGIVGESGSGKTMTCSALLSLLPAGAHRTADRLQLDSLDLTSVSPTSVRGRLISMISQDPAAALNPVFTIQAHIDAVLKQHTDKNRHNRRTAILELLDAVGLPDPLRVSKRYPHQLSGGMQQRAVIAMALSAGAQVLIADEPTTALDVSVQAKILDLLQSLRHNLALSILLVSHDLAVIAQVCDRVVVMLNGEIVETGTVQSVIQAPQHPYTKALLAASPARHQRGNPLPTVASSYLNSGFDHE